MKEPMSGIANGVVNKMAYDIVNGIAQCIVISKLKDRLTTPPVLLYFQNQAEQWKSLLWLKKTLAILKEIER